MATIPTSPYPTAAQVMNRARSFVNDSYQKGAGRILTNSAAFSVEFLNSALEELQERIRNNGVITLYKDNVIIGPIPPLAAPDPTQQILLAYTGLFINGAWLPTPTLPLDVMIVEKVWEQQLGSGLPFAPMNPVQDGLPSLYQGPYLRMWEYRQDGIAMLGSTTTEQLRLRYQFALGTIGKDIVTPSGSESWDNTQISVLGSVNSLGMLVGARYAAARGAQAAPTAAADAEKYMRLLINRYVRRAQRIKFRRRPYGDTNMGNGRPNQNLPY
jgi:hypothetical protein